jgi:hypothetical protein
MATPAGTLQLALEESPVYENAPVVAPYRVSTNVAYLPLQSARVNANPTHIDRADEQRGIEGAVPRILDMFEPDGNITIRAYPNLLPYLLECAGFIGVRTAGGAAVASPDKTAVAAGGASLDSAVINVDDTTLFPATGSIIVNALAITYTGKTATSFTGCGSHAALTAGTAVFGNIPVNVSKWVFTKRSALTAKTMQLLACYVESNLFLKGNGYGVSQISLDQDGAMSADLMGLVVKRIADPNLTPTYDTQAIPPFRKVDLFLKWLTGSGESDGFSMALANSLERRRSFGTARSYYADRMFQGDARVAATGSIPKFGLDPDDMDALLAASYFEALARYQSDKVVGATAYPYSMWIEMPACQIVGGQADELGNRRRYGATYDWFAAYDETAGYDVKITLANAVAAINTFA